MAKIVGKRYIGLGVIAAMAALSWWLQREEQALDTRKKAGAHIVDYAIRDFEIISMDDAGLPRHRMRAVSMVHYADDNSADLKQPYLWIYRDEGEPWSIYSDDARVFQGGSVVLLQGDVRMRQQDEGRNIIELDTRDLWVYSEQEFAESSELVVVRDQNSVTRAEGVKIDLKTSNIKLLAKVRGEYGLDRQ